ncbi:hypothetical protein CPLU01_08064 [Colletotrichum plurivorum]|uniref:Uncharacterized protein n=1 Tax=Colletotrichum plurivorum TaxID=2175906 RepID=A0A8H6NDC9_9PEZI|nr:hypothetical protein CPLU01_08064 [Colletotrichum plurivorum]
MGIEADATAPGPSEKRNLPAGYEDETAQDWKRPCISHLLQPDATEPYQTPPVEYLETDLNGPVTTECRQINDASIGASDTWNHGEHLLSNFGTSWSNIQSDVSSPAVGGVGFDGEIKIELDGTQRDPTSIDTPGDAKETNTVGAIHLYGFDSRCDTCFEVINTSVTTSLALEQGTPAVPVRLKPFEGLSMLYFEESNEYAGIVTVPALSKLLTGYTTKITATLSTPEPQRETTVSRKKVNDTVSYRKNSQFLLCIIVYGTMEESSEIGKLLSDAGLYFQHPSANELNVNVAYFNPHYLARPGAGMPQLEELQISCSNDTDAKTAGILDETNKARLLRIFDGAYDEGITPTATASPRLRSSLKP